jgi:putative ABC transport system permease protein
MRALDRKVLRDLRLMWSQALTIALVVASGIAGLITTLSAVDSLALARDQFYADGYFADVFAGVKRAPDSLIERFSEIPGVADVQTTIEQRVRIEIEGVGDPMIGQLIGVDRHSAQSLNQIVIRRGQAIDTTSDTNRSSGTLDVVVSEGFAATRRLQEGSLLTALINGKQRQLRIVGTAVSPEYIFASMSGMPDVRGFGVFWVDQEALASAYDMKGAFNRVALKLSPNADRRLVIDTVDRIISPYGGREAYDREDQASHSMLESEIKEQHVLGSVVTTIFAAVAAFLLNVVITRLVSTQREQVATLKALGYPNTLIGIHYMKLVLAIVAVGLIIGIGLGKWFGGLFVGLYKEFFRFPEFEHTVAPWLIAIGIAVALFTAISGTLSAILATIRLTPAEAMRPPSPGRYRRTITERLLDRARIIRFSPALRMILRNMERRPLRTTLSIGGIAVAVALVIMGNFIRDAIGNIVDTTFNVSMRSDVTVWMVEPTAAAVGIDLSRLPGVISVESGRDIPVRFVHGHRIERGSIQGYAEQPELRRIVDIDLRQHYPPAQGILMTDRLAEKLGLRVGDTVTVETLEGRQAAYQIPVAATVSEMMGLNAYMERHALNRMMKEGDLASQFSVAIERGGENAFLKSTKSIPRIAGAFSKASLWRNMQEISARNIRIMSTVLTTFAVIIATGVVYNNARIALSERTWELASLRVLGFTRAEVSFLLLGEMAISIAVALPLGMLFGYGLVHMMIELLKSDEFMFPVVILPRTYALAALSVLAAGAASAWVVRRRVDRLDMVAALKTRE